MARLTPRQSQAATLLGIIVYIAVVVGVIVWLAIHGAETRHRREALAPYITMTLAAPQPVAVPSSWTDSKATVEPAKTEPPKLAEQHPAEVQTPSVTPVAMPPTAAQTPVSGDKWRAHARPFDLVDKRPRITLVISQLGLSRDMVDHSIGLPGEITLAFAGTTTDLEKTMAQARTAGHETLLAVGMEPEDYPQNDPGPGALLTGLPDAENISRLNRAMAQSDGYVGIMPFMGDKFVASEQKLTPILQAIKDSGLVFFDATSGEKDFTPPVARYLKLPFIRNDRVIDAATDQISLDEQLAQLEKTAHDDGHVTAVIVPYPLVLEKLAAWSATLAKKNIALAPLTSAITP